MPVCVSSFFCFILSARSIPKRRSRSLLHSSLPPQHLYHVTLKRARGYRGIAPLPWRARRCLRDRLSSARTVCVPRVPNILSVPRTALHTSQKVYGRVGVIRVGYVIPDILLDIYFSPGQLRRCRKASRPHTNTCAAASSNDVRVL